MGHSDIPIRCTGFDRTGPVGAGGREAPRVRHLLHRNAPGYGTSANVRSWSIHHKDWQLPLGTGRGTRPLTAATQKGCYPYGVASLCLPGLGAVRRTVHRTSHDPHRPPSLSPWPLPLARRSPLHPIILQPCIKPSRRLLYGSSSAPSCSPEIPVVEAQLALALLNEDKQRRRLPIATVSVSSLREVLPEGRKEHWPISSHKSSTCSSNSATICRLANCHRSTSSKALDMSPPVVMTRPVCPMAEAILTIPAVIRFRRTSAPHSTPPTTLLPPSGGGGHPPCNDCTNPHMMTSGCINASTPMDTSRKGHM